MHKLTEKELSILEEIENDGNKSAKDLCKSLRVKESTLRYHLRKLNAAGLTRMVPKINFAALRFKRYRILLSFSCEHGLCDREALEAIKPHVFAARLDHLSGEFSHALGVVVKSESQLKSALSALSHVLKVDVKEKQVLQVESSKFLGRSYLFSKKREATLERSSIEPIQIDEKEMAILAYIFNFPYRARTEVAKALLTPPSTLDYKISKMERLGAISKWYIEINSAALGMSRFKLHLALKSLSSSEREKTLLKLVHLPNIVDISLLLGEFDLSLTIEARNAREYLEVRQKILEKVNGNLSKATSLQVLSEADYFSLAAKEREKMEIAA